MKRDLDDHPHSFVRQPFLVTSHLRDTRHSYGPPHSLLALFSPLVPYWVFRRCHSSMLLRSLRRAVSSSEA